MGKVYLRKEVLERAIIDYYSQTTTNPLDVDIKLSIYEDEINIAIDLLEYKGEGKLVCCESRPLTMEDLEKVLLHYLKNSENSYESFKYMGGIRRVGYFMLEDTPIFEGIEITVKNKGFSRKLRQK